MFVLSLTSGRTTFATVGANPTTLAKCPAFQASNFSHPTVITNEFLPWFPGTLFIYSGTSSGQPSADHTYVTHQTTVVDGIQTVVVNDTGYVKGKLTELTLDFYAQDNFGNVWYMGENATTYANGHVTGQAGSWLAGVHGAKPGYVMETDPTVGDFYCQENSPGAAQDQAQILSLTTSVCTPYACNKGHTLLTNETSPLEPGTVEHKWYIAGVGNVKAMDVKGGTDQEQLVAVLTIQGGK